jgi:S1-C subfamily serine protease
MNWSPRLWAFLFLLCLSGNASFANDLPSTIDTIRGSIVGVGTLKRNLRQLETNFYGTGFVVGDGARIVTNYHVYRGIVGGKKPAGELVVFSGRGEKAHIHRVTLERADAVHDLALLRLKQGRLPAMKLAGDRMRREGEEVAFTGFPIGMVLGLYPVTHRGTISAITPIVIPADSGKKLTAAQVKRIRDKRFEVYQLDGTAYPGNSGSPVYEIDSGKVIGVINSVFVKGTKEAALEDPSGISYAIPVKYVRRLLREK